MAAQRCSICKFHRCTLHAVRQRQCHQTRAFRRAEVNGCCCWWCCGCSCNCQQEETIPSFINSHELHNAVRMRQVRHTTKTSSCSKCSHSLIHFLTNSASQSVKTFTSDLIKRGQGKVKHEGTLEQHSIHLHIHSTQLVKGKKRDTEDL